MTQRRINDAKDIGVDEDVNQLYEVKSEYLFHTKDGTHNRLFHPVILSGEDEFTPTGSATMTKSVGVAQKISTVNAAFAQTRDPLVFVGVESVTASGLTMTISVSSNNISDVVSSVAVDYMILGSD